MTRRDRSLLNIALLAASNRSHALHYHVQVAITNGATEEEIRETLVHLIPYCGFPAAFDAFEIAEKALREESSETASQANDGRHERYTLAHHSIEIRNERELYGLTPYSSCEQSDLE